MAHKIDSKIKGYSLVKPKEKVEAPTPAYTKISMHENLARPEILVGATYKVKPPQSEHAFYITVNDMVLNEGTDHEERRPYEIFINSKNTENFQWVIAVTRVISAVFRKGGDIVFLVEELKAVFDPRGGYFKKGGVFMPSIVAEIGWVLESHFTRIGLIKPKVLDTNIQKFIEEKKAGLSEFPATATVCPKCSVKAAVLMDGCSTCLSCGDSKCN